MSRAPVYTLDGFPPSVQRQAIAQIAAAVALYVDRMPKPAPPVTDDDVTVLKNLMPRRGLL